MTFQLPDGLPSPIKPAFIPKYEAEKQLSSEFSTSRSGSFDSLINEQAIRDAVPDAQFPLEESQTFETTAESLQGIENGFNQDYFWQQSIVGIQEIPPELIEVKAAAPEPRETHREDWLIDENDPEPVSEPVVNFSTDVAGIPDERVQWRATLWGGFMTGNDLGETLIGRSLVFKDSGFLGAGFSRTLAGGNSIKLEGEIQVLQHTGQQDHLEGTAALSLRWQMSPSFSIAAIGLYGNADGGSNAYLMGLRYRF